MAEDATTAQGGEATFTGELTGTIVPASDPIDDFAFVRIREHGVPTTIYLRKMVANMTAETFALGDERPLSAEEEEDQPPAYDSSQHGDLVLIGYYTDTRRDLDMATAFHLMDLQQWDDYVSRLDDGAFPCTIAGVTYQSSQAYLDHFLIHDLRTNEALAIYRLFGGVMGSIPWLPDVIPPAHRRHVLQRPNILPQLTRSEIESMFNVLEQAVIASETPA